MDPDLDLPPEDESRNGQAARFDRRAGILWLKLVLIIVGICCFPAFNAIAQGPRWDTIAPIVVVSVVLLLQLALVHSCRGLATYYAARRRTSNPIPGRVATWLTPREASPQSFRRRLAVYLHLPESEVMPLRPRPKSAMSFWSSVSLTQHTTTMKSVEYIRAVLERIRHAVRGG